MISEEGGYEKLFKSGRLSEAGKAAIRERLLQIAERDPCGGVRITATQALRGYAWHPADAAFLDRLRGLYEREQSPTVKAALDHALEELGSGGAAKQAEALSRPTSADLRRMLAEAGNSSSSPWGEAVTYRKTVAEKTTEQLLQDFWTFRDPPDDEIGRQNATLKRDAAFDQLDERIRLGEIRDMKVVQDHLARMLSEEPDPIIRKFVAWGALKTIAERGGRTTRAEIVQLFEKRLPDEPDRYVRAALETAIEELKNK